MLPGFGVTAMDVKFWLTADTTSVAFPLTPLREAVMVVEPEATAVASPDELIVATVVVADVQVAVELKFFVEPSLYVPVAVNCWVAATAMLAEFGVTAMEVSVAVDADTVNIAVPLTPLMEAVMVEEPEATAVASPLELIVATVVVADVQVAVVLTFAVVPSL
jgi:hypothetical protein